MLGKPGCQIFRFELGETPDDEKGICGGAIELLVETFDASALPLFEELSAAALSDTGGILVSMVWPDGLPRKILLQDVAAIDNTTSSGFAPEIVTAIEDVVAAGHGAKKVSTEGLDVFIESLTKSPMAILFGAGHLATCIARYAKTVHFKVAVCDDRAEYANAERFPDADEIVVEDFNRVFKTLRIDAHSYIVIVTRGHKCDQIVLEQALNTDARYIGMIGSRRKTQTLIDKLREGNPPRNTRSGLLPHRHFHRRCDASGDCAEHRGRTGEDKTAGIRGTGWPYDAAALERILQGPVMIEAIVLAAGESRRMEKPKPLLRFGSATFLEQIISVLRRSTVDRITVVLGAKAEMIADSVDLSKARVVVNTDYRQGQLSSLIAGLKKTPADTEAIVLCLVDNPLITPEIVDRIIEVFKQTQSPIVLPTFGGKRGHPALFSKLLFDDLRNAPTDMGARHVVHAHEDRIVEVEMSDDTILAKIDTPEEYRSHFGLAP